MTAITQLRAGALPGPWLVISDKTPDAPVTDRGDTRITSLYCGVNIGKARTFADKTPNIDSGTVRDDTAITQLRVGANIGAVRTFTDKTPTSELTIPGSDTYTVFAQLGNTEDVTLELTDTYYPLAAFAGSVQVLVSATDGYTLGSVLTAAAPISSGATPVNAADTLTPVATFATTFVGLLITGTDTYTPVATDDSGTGPEKVDLVVSSDTYTPVMSWGWRRTIETTEYRSAVDQYTPVLTFTSTVTAYNTDVDQITHKLRPTGLIRHKFV